MAALEKAALRVSEQVLLQAVGLLERLPTLATAVVTPTFRAIVPEFVQRGGKTVPALDAQVGGVFTLAEPVAGQERGGPEGPPTLGAVVGLQPTVDPLVFQEDRVILEALVAFGALEHPRLLPSARGRRHVRPFRRFGEVGGRRGVRGEFLVEHDDLGNVVAFVVTGTRV